jgi:muconolactone delta-isomerase
MKILAIERDLAGIPDSAFTDDILKGEATRAWELYQSGHIRELYFRQDKSAAVLVLELPTVDDARTILASLPLVRHKLIDFELIPLAPYPGFARLFQE